MQTSLFERLGGEAAILACVGLFYEKVLLSPSVARFFEGLDMPAQVQKQTEFLTMACGGKPTDAGKDLTQAHSHLVEDGLADEHFDEVGRLLQEALRELGVSEPDVAEVLTIVEDTRPVVLGRAR